ncbi:MAG TPA: type IV pilus assembly protein PilM [Lacipirellulaceae bacterium]|nr:type IV pilus assembly protein PilM [Lacipirellulaceae bacterium]
MAKSNAVWGIDIGQCALKALRCRPHDKDDKRIVVEAFDYIEYPKILTQPEANRDELIREALEQFVSRNDVTSDRVAIAVPGQSGLARFIKLPPVERKKIPDIVKYEARQQIPFALEDVVWDYQPLVGSEDEGYALETEVGLFAMKRDQVARALKPLEDAGIGVDIIQLAPLAIYNFICFDRLDLDGKYDPASPPPSTVIISLGTDTTDLVITNGYRVWQRSIPIGGNHFTKALTKELKLTFAKAEHLKRNAMKAENPKAVFQAMRPVFSDLVAEIQRSIGFFTSNNRTAKLGDMVALGNPMKLPGLQRFLSQNLDQEVKLIDSFNNLVQGTATASPQFKENQLTFGVAYGLCVQALDAGQLRTNLLPEEIVTTRLVKAKKPWAVAAVALLLVGMTVNYFGHYSSWKTADKEDPAMKSAIAASASAKQLASGFESTFTTQTSKFDEIKKIGENLQSNVDGRLLWLEVIKAVDSALPRDERPAEERKETVEDVAQRPELHIESVDCEYFEDVAPWYTSILPQYVAAKKEAGQEVSAELSAEAEAAEVANEQSVAEAATATDTAPGEGPAADGTGAPASDAASTDGAATDPNATAPADDPNAASPDADQNAASPTVESTAEAPAADPMADPSATAAIDPATGQPMDGSATTGLTGPGWVIEMRGYHLHNSLRDEKIDVGDEGDAFILNTFFKNLETGTVKLPDGPNGELIDVPISELGIKFPVVVTSEQIIPVAYYAEAIDPNAVGGMPATPTYERGELGPGAAANEVEEPKVWNLRRYNFIIQFCWQPQPRGKRLEKQNGEQQEQGEAANTAAVEGDAAPAGDSS